MSISSNNSNDRVLTHPRSSFIEAEQDSGIRRNSLPNILPELTKLVRKLLPHELSLNIHVRNVDYFEYGCERLSGTLYMTVFRLIFAPDNEVKKNNIITSGNRYIGEYDIPLTSIYKIIVAPLEARSSLRAFLADPQLQAETKAFTILTRDFRYITFSKSIAKKPNSLATKPEISLTKMETYINSLRLHSRFQHKAQLYPHLVTQKAIMLSQSPKAEDDYGFFSSTSPTIDDDLADFSTSNDERIKSYFVCQDWQDELTDANETRWQINTEKFDKNNTVQSKGPFIYLPSSNPSEDYKNLIWHWTHTCDLETNPTLESPAQHMLVTITGIADVPNPSDSRRRSTTETTLNYSCHYIYEQIFQRFNLAKFPCTLKQLELSFEKLVEICTTPLEEDEEKWWTKLNTCRWLRYVSKALQGAASIAKTLNFKNIQLAGSDIDNSCLMSSLIQVFLRPQCRTIKGFSELIIREWIIPGHPFRERFGQVISDNDKSPAQESPIFLLFLDCIYQLLNQNPPLFEFTEYFLIQIYHNVCYCFQHTFAFNSIGERLKAIENYPKNILILSAFDFSLYMDVEMCHLLKNHASVFLPKKKIPPPTMPRTRPPPSANKMTKIQHFLEKNLNFNPARRISQKMPSPTIETSPPPPPPPPPIPESFSVKPEQFKYENLEAPQKFASELYVDWRMFNLVLWSKCYCRYDQSYLPTSIEQELSNEISANGERLEKKSPESPTATTSNSIRYANSWHPQMLVTRI